MKLKLSAILLLIFLFITPQNSLAQKLSHVPGEIMVQLKPGISIDAVVKALYLFDGIPTHLKAHRQLSRSSNIWLLKFNQNRIHEFRFLQQLKSHPKIDIAQFNHLVKMRSTIPDDASFADQWQYINDGSNNGLPDADIDADLAWDITTGGVTELGDTIVVAVLDTGIDLNHDDFGDNLWVNHAEIPGNNVDDDNNGYIDDYRGWSIITDNDNIAASTGHGTSVAGIIGAKTNNQIGVSGVNWNVKLMIIKNNFNANEAAVLEAYSYALDARIKYNESNGSEGAFVVATNASWGVDLGDPEDAPIWCAFFDTLGQAGILNCGATVNQNYDVDQVGDLPTSCPSDYLIAVTNVDRTDTKFGQAGFGLESIDLGAPGHQVFTTSFGNNYGLFGGTSGATPHVAGAIALLYAAPCDNLPALAQLDPPAAALMARNYILEGVDLKSSLEGITVTGGRLNLFNSLTLLMDQCSPCPEAYHLGVSGLTDVNASLNWSDGVFAVDAHLRWRQVGSANWNEFQNVVAPFQLSGLTECTDYEFQIDAICPTGNSGYTASFIFTTDGCCLPPSNITISDLTTTTVTIEWNSILAAEAYNLHLFSATTGDFFITNHPNTFINLSDLSPCTDYSIAVQTVCQGEDSEYSEPVFFATFGCGACTDLNYCTSMGDDTDVEWIEAIAIGNLSNTSGSDDGYGNFTGLFSDFILANSYNVSLTPGFLNNTFNEYFKVWIDFDQNGEFDPQTELAFDAGTPMQTTVSGALFIPETAVLGLTRMRIAMQWEGPTDDEEPEPCELIDFGEVEDYCINIIDGDPSNCDFPINLDTSNVSKIAAQLSWEDFTDDHDNHNLRIRKTSTSEWALFTTVNSPYFMENLDECSNYEFQVQANCSDGVSMSDFTESFEFKTKCTIGTTPGTDLEVSIFPNPFDAVLKVKLKLNQSGPISFHLYDTAGRIVLLKTLLSRSTNQTIDIEGVEKLSPGIYFLSILTAEGTLYQKVIKT